MTRPTDSRGGFTLIEMLITIAILALVLTTIYGVLLTTLTTRDRVSERLQAHRVGPALVRLLHDDLRAAGGFAGDGAPFRSFDAQVASTPADSLHFRREAPPRLGRPDEPARHSEVGWTCDENPDMPGVLRLHRREQAGWDGDVTAGGGSLEIWDRVVWFEVDQVDLDGNLVGEWVERDDVPQAVVVRLGVWAGDMVPGERAPRISRWGQEVEDRLVLWFEGTVRLPAVRAHDFDWAALDIAPPPPPAPGEEDPEGDRSIEDWKTGGDDGGGDESTPGDDDR